MCLETPQQETNMACPRPIFYEKGAASPKRGEAGGEKGNLQKRIYTDWLKFFLSFLRALFSFGIPHHPLTQTAKP
jgi:hypothetical protein